jgi:thiamine pyrophosphokinase
MNPDLKMYLLSAESMAFLLLPGPRHAITVNTQIQGPTCGLLPIGSEDVRMETEGLKWDLDTSMSLQFGKLVSSSNALNPLPSGSSRHTVYATTNKPVVFTIQINLTKQ